MFDLKADVKSAFLLGLTPQNRIIAPLAAKIMTRMTKRSIYVAYTGALSVCKKPITASFP